MQTTFIHDPAAPASPVQPLGPRMTMAYDGGGPVKPFQPSGCRTNMVYDPEGRKILPKDPPADAGDQPLIVEAP